ncbi:hypothetical protein [Phocaeicola paurosaccharolyticus]|uniref:hypothetical protein n=1 Tax=Phocaeicola paurosaccharolyticus TaxID=732242 RepID=UPI002FE11739
MKSNNRKIGFKNYEYDPEKDEEKKEDKKSTAIAEFIKTHYSPIGATSDKVYKTSLEIRYDLSNIVDVTVAELATQLSSAGFHVEYIGGQPFWVMYEKI